MLVNLYVMGLCWPSDSLSSKEHQNADWIAQKSQRDTLGF